MMRHASALGLRLAALSVLAAPEAVAARQRPPDTERCVACHRDLEEENLSRPVLDFETDVHAEHGFVCMDCHGPDPTGAATRPDPTTGFLSKPLHRGVSDMCGRCHANGEFMRGYNPDRRIDQVSEYATSVHGTLLAESNDQNVAVCVSCHPAHRIKPPSDTESSVHPLNVATTCGACHADTVLMAPYDIPTDQKALYEQSVHWSWMTEEGDLSVATCNDCHGNHGAAPPGVASIQNVCGQCHNVMATLFIDGPHADYFNAEGLPGCATCHGNHDIGPTNDAMLPELNESVCQQCHAQGEVGSTEFLEMKLLIDSLQASLDLSRVSLDEAENLGMEVSQAQFDLEEVNTALVKARTAIHAFTADSVRVEVEAGLVITASAQERAHAALGEHLFRRQGLAVSVGLILLVIWGIYLLIRQIERPTFTGQATGARHHREEYDA